MPGGVLAEGLVKRFGSFTALDGVDFRVPEGTVVGLLGPNGAGKTTTIRILTTLLRPDGGRAEVAGYDVVTQPQLVRATIGLTGQYAAVDEELTGRENLVLVGRLCRLAEEPGQGAGRPDADGVLAGRCGRPAAADLLGRHAAAPRPGRQPDGVAAGAVPRRAHHRSRPTQPARALGRDRGAPRPGHHDRPHDAVPRGGRPARAEHQRDRRRQHHRRGHRRRAEGPGRRRRARPDAVRPARASTPRRTSSPAPSGSTATTSWSIRTSAASRRRCPPERSR